MMHSFNDCYCDDIYVEVYLNFLVLLSFAVFTPILQGKQFICPYGFFLII